MFGAFLLTVWSLCLTLWWLVASFRETTENLDIEKMQITEMKKDKEHKIYEENWYIKK